MLWLRIKIYENHSMNQTWMKYLLMAFAFFLPLHALLVTTLKCRFWLDTDLFRFWKELVVIGLLFGSVYAVGKRYKWNYKKFLEWNYIVGIPIVFAIIAFIYMYFPYFKPGIHSYLGYKYDVFFLFTLIAGFSLYSVRKYFDSILRALFASIGLILIVFLPWYLFFDISAVAGIFGYSSEVSTYTANACISFSQNVEGQHRFQWTFGWPIRFSVFLIVWLFVYVGYILDTKLTRQKKYLFIGIPTLFIFLSVFFSYSKTSILWLFVWILIFFAIVRRYIFETNLSEKQVKFLKFAPLILIFTAGLLVFLKRDLFTHLGSMINRLDNLQRAVQMFFYNPIGYGVGTAWPATQIADSIEAYSYEWAANSAQIFKYLPENWYVQMLVEMSFVGLALFLAILIVIGYYLFQIMKVRKTYFSVAIFTSFVTLCFMANFTHAFEETATSYLFFLIIWAYIAQNYGIFQKKKLLK